MEKRRVPRTTVDWKVSVRFGKQVTQGRALQMSEYGMMVAPPEAAQVGQRCELTFAVPGQKDTLKIRGIGVYTTPRGVGIRFEQVPPDITATLRNHLSNMPAAAPGTTAPGSAGR